MSKQHFKKSFKIGEMLNFFLLCSTPLSLACWKGHLEVVKLLIDNGANIEAQDFHTKSKNPFGLAGIEPGSPDLHFSKSCCHVQLH